jgi:hypothetical protein
MWCGHIRISFEAAAVARSGPSSFNSGLIIYSTWWNQITGSSCDGPTFFLVLSIPVNGVCVCVSLCLILHGRLATLPHFAWSSIISQDRNGTAHTDASENAGMLQ